MLHPKLIRGFLIRFGVVYGLLIVPWPGIEEAYAYYFRAIGQYALGSFGSKGIVRFEAETERIRYTMPFDTKVLVANREIQLTHGKSRAGSFHTNSRYGGYLPTALVAALILASPLPRRRRLRALCWGMILVHGFILLKLTIEILCAYNREEWLSLFLLNPLWKTMLFSAQWILGNVESGFFVPVLIWIPATFRREDRDMILPKADSSKGHRWGASRKRRRRKRGRR